MKLSILKAVVRFPVDDKDRLRTMVDRNVAFGGTLTSCSAFVKTLLLVDGQVNEE